MPFVKRTARPDYPSYLGPTARNMLDLGRGYKPGMDNEESMRLLNSLEQADRNMTMASTLKHLGGDPEKAMAPATQKQTESSPVARLFDVLDKVMGAPAIRYGIAKAQGAPLYDKSVWGGDGKRKVQFSDIIRYFQDTALGGSKDTAGQRWARGIGGFAGDVATDPVTWLSFGAGAGAKIGGKTVSKLGAEILKKAAPAFNAAKDKKAAMETIKAALEQAASAGQKVYSSPATRLFGQKIGPDPFSALGKGIKSGYSTLKEYANPVNAETMGLGRTLAGKAVSGIEDIGSAISTKFGLPAEYLTMRRAFDDQLNAAGLTIKDELKTIFTKADGKVASKKDRIKIAQYIDDPKNFSIAADLKPVADNVKKKFAELAKELQEKDLLGSTIKDYMTHSVGKGLLPRFLRTEKTGSRLSTSLGGPQEKRHYGTFSELFEAQPGLKSITEQDAAKILGKYWATAEKSKAVKKFMDDVTTLSQTKTVGEEGLRTPFQERIASALTDFTPKTKGMELKDIPIRVAKDLERIDNPKYAKGFIGYRSAHNAWKGMVTVVNPAFHVRNTASNQVLSALDVGKEMLDPRLYVDVVGVLGKRQGKIVTRQGLEYTYDEIRQLAKETGVLKAGWGRKETELVTGLPGIAAKYNPIKAMGKVGNFIENEGRITNFIAHLRKGDDPFEAAQGVSKALFDYSDLTNMDRAIKWVIPFWTFSRKSAELMAKTLITNPGRVTAEMRLGQNIGGAILGGKDVSGEDMRGLPEFYKEGLKVAKIGKDGALQVLSGLGLPIEDLENYPVFSGFGRLGSKAVVGRASPILKIPMEIISNRDYFFGAPLDPTGMIKNPDGTTSTAYNKAYPVVAKMPQAVKDFLEFEEIPGRNGQPPSYTINSLKLKYLELFALGIASAAPTVGAPLIFSRYYRDIGKLTDESKPRTPRILDALTGVRIYDVPGGADLRTRAAASQTAQIGNLLSQSLGKQKRKMGY